MRGTVPPFPQREGLVLWAGHPEATGAGLCVQNKSLLVWSSSWTFQRPLPVIRALSVFSVSQPGSQGEMAPRPPPQAGLRLPMQYVGLATAGSARHPREGKVKVIQLQQDGRVQKQTSWAGRRCRGPSVPGVRKEPTCPQGLLSSSLMVTVFTSVYSARAYSPSSRPFPDILKPPNGACA